jgi:antitoxin PrlF
MPTSEVKEDGQVTLPREVREHLHLQTGDRIDFEIDPQGTVHLHPLHSSVQDLFGLLHRPDVPPRTIEEMREGMIEFLVEENERVKRDE